MATKKTGASTPALDPKVADKLLDKLSTDNEFRRLFKKDPAAALVKVGHPKEAALATAGCCRVQTIAPKDQVVRTRNELRLMLTSGLGQTPPTLDSSSSTRRLRK